MSFRINDKVVTQEELEAAQVIWDEGFHVPSGRHYLDDFPVWDPRIHQEFEWNTVPERGIPTSLVLTRPVKIQFNGSAPVPARIVGGVATAERARGQGNVSALIHQLIQITDQERDSEPLLLWGSEHTFYAKWGFVPFGNQLRGKVSDLSAGAAPRSSLGVSVIETSSYPELFRNLQKQRERWGGLVLSERDQSWVAAHRNVVWVGAWDQSGKLAAGLGFSRGIDLPYQVHEWFGPLDAVRMLLGVIQTRVPEAEVILSPTMREDWEAAGYRFSEWIEEPLCLIRDPKKKVQESELWLWGLDSA